MKQALLIALTCLTCTVHATEPETTAKKKVTHHLQFLIGNYIGISPMTWHSGSISFPVYNSSGTNPGSLSGYHIVDPSNKPLYSYSLGFDYKAEFSKRIGLRTGIDYFTLGTTVDAIGVYPPSESVRVSVYIFNSSLLIPIHLMVFEPLAKGRFIFTVGPDLNFLVNTFGKETTVAPNIAPSEIHYHVSSSDFRQGSSLGFTLGLGFERSFGKGTVVEFMPDFRMLNAVPFDFQGQGVNIYHSYVFNMAIGLSTYITFY